MQSEAYRKEMQSFYSSLEWKQCREGYKRYRCFICERCGETSKKMIVHHKIELDPIKAKDPSISLNWDNLELLCINCHNTEHKKKSRRYTVDENGRVSPL